MMKLTIRLFLAIFFLVAFLNLSAVIIGEKTPFMMQNGKKYYLVKPGKLIKYKMQSSNTVTIYARAVISKDTAKSYYFKIITADGERTYKRKLKPSKSLKNVNNQMFSTLSKIRLNLKYFKIKNISDFPIVVRVKTEGREKFIEYSPQKYGEAKEISINNRTYTYYQAKKNIELTFEGPLYLKIISRKIINNPDEHYEYSIYDNGKLKEKKLANAIKSKKATLISSKNTISKGNVSVIKFDKGKHKVSVSTNDKLLFKFYINKNAVKVIK